MKTSSSNVEGKSFAYLTLHRIGHNVREHVPFNRKFWIEMTNRVKIIIIIIIITVFYYSSSHRAIKDNNLPRRTALVQ